MLIFNNRDIPFLINMRKSISIIILVVFSSTASAQLDSSIQGECSSRQEPVISISDPIKTYSHLAEPGYYDNQLCIDGISESTIQQNRCDSSTGFHISSREDNAHFSKFSPYRLNVCTGEMTTRITSEQGSCRSNETELFSVSSEDNAHVSGKGIFKHIVCGSYTTPENVTMELEFNLTNEDNVSFDEEEVNGEQEYQSADFPAFTVEGDQMTSGLIASDFKTASRSFEQSENVYRIDSGFPSSVIIPFTSGNSQDIQNRKELILQNNLLNQIKPSFENQMPERSVIRVIYSPEIQLDSNIDQGPGGLRFNVTKTGDERIGLYR